MKDYKIDQSSYERFKEYTKEEVNKLLKNVYEDGYKSGRQYMKDKMPKEDRKAFITQIGIDLCDMIDRAGMRGISDKTKERFKKIILEHMESYLDKGADNG